MSVALPKSMRQYIDNRVSMGHYGNTSEFIRDRVRREQYEQAKKRLCDLMEEGLSSGPGRRRTKVDERELLAIARGEIDSRLAITERKPGPCWRCGWSRRPTPRLTRSNSTPASARR